MYILKCFINYAKEEKWLTEMSKKGYELVSPSFGYTFRKQLLKKQLLELIIDHLKLK